MCRRLWFGFATFLAKNVEFDDVKTKDKFAEALSAGWHGIITIAIAVTYIWPLLIIATGVLTYIMLKKPFRKTLPLQN